jgi:large subunit ribosomal protein L1
MANSGKKYRAALAKIDRNKKYTVEDTFKLLKETAGLRSTKFDQTVDVAINLGVDPKHADQMVRGAVVLPHGTGKSKKVIVFAKGDRAKEAEAAGADVVGAEDLAKRIEEGFVDFEATVATPDLMGLVGRLGKVLGPRGLMPNPKVGTVTTDVARAVREIKGGKVEFRVEKAGIVHCPVGKASFNPDQLKNNFLALMETIYTTMGPGIKVDPTELNTQFRAA